MFSTSSVTSVLPDNFIENPIESILKINNSVSNKFQTIFVYHYMGLQPK